MPAHSKPIVDAVFRGGPRAMLDEQGPWLSSIQRERVYGGARVSMQGIVGDRVTQPYHGGPDAALCCHLADHYDFWKSQYGVDLEPGAVGENLTLSGITEEAIYVGDVIRVGTVLAQVSGPRVPCANQARHIGRADWVRLTVRENRTGFYLRVLEPGVLQEGDAWELIQRFNRDAAISSVNRCMYLDFDPAYAHRMKSMVGIAEWWKQQAAKRVSTRGRNWTGAMKDSGNSW